MGRTVITLLIGAAVGLVAAIAISEALNQGALSQSEASRKSLDAELVERDKQIQEVTAQRDEGADLLRQVVELSNDNPESADNRRVAQSRSPLDRVTKQDPTYSLVRLNWVAHNPPQAVDEKSPLLAESGLVEVDKGHIPLTMRLAEGEALGLGRGLFPHFPYFLGFRRRSEIVDELRKSYPSLTVLDESNGVSGETHVAHLRPGLSAAIFGSWYNPWSIAVVSASGDAPHQESTFNEWAQVCEHLAQSPRVNPSWLKSVGPDTIAFDDGVASYTAWKFLDENSPREMLFFSTTSLEAPVRIGLPRK